MCSVKTIDPNTETKMKHGKCFVLGYLNLSSEKDMQSNKKWKMQKQMLVGGIKFAVMFWINPESKIFVPKSKREILKKF